MGPPGKKGSWRNPVLIISKSQIRNSKSEIAMAPFLPFSPSPLLSIAASHSACLKSWYLDTRDRKDDPTVFGIEIMSEQTCQHCARFADDPAVIESEIPGLTSFGSAYSSARGYAGICRVFDRFMDPMLARDCPSFISRTVDREHPSTDRPSTEFQIRERE